MSEKPILFNGEMVRAILEEKKTQTRRVIKPQPGSQCEKEFSTEFVNQAWQAGFIRVACPYGKPGDRLWVRETWGEVMWRVIFGDAKPPQRHVVYKAGPHAFDDD